MVLMTYKIDFMAQAIKHAKEKNRSTDKSHKYVCNCNITKWYIRK